MNRTIYFGIIFILILIFPQSIFCQDIYCVSKSLLMCRYEKERNELIILSKLNKEIFDIAVTPSGKIYANIDYQIFSVDKTTGQVNELCSSIYYTSNSLMALSETELVFVGREKNSSIFKLIKVDISNECKFEVLGVIPIHFTPAGDITWWNGSFLISTSKDFLLRIPYPQHSSDTLQCERLAAIKNAPWAMFNSGNCDKQLFGFSSGGLKEYDPMSGTEKLVYPVVLWEEILGASCTNEYANTDASMSFLPNLITANDDGLNDVFQIVNNTSSLKQLQIYNNWGALVYEETSISPVWDGYSGNSICSEGIYFYTILNKECPVDPIQGYLELHY